MSVLYDTIMLRRVYGDDAATATVVRNLLAPVAGLQLDDSDLHRRCVLVKHIGTLKDARDAFEPFGTVVAVASWLYLCVVVFEAAADAALALRSPVRSLIGVCKAVPSLDLAAAYRFIPPADIKVSGSAVASGTPELTVEARALAFRELCELKPMIQYHDPAVPVYGAGPPGTKRFVASEDSLVHGPTMGSDGHLWMHGTLITSHVCGIDFRQSASVRVRQEQVGSTKIRVTPLTPIVYVPYEDD
ncbi:unnamed protein product [Alopecurus aequalis]